MKDQSFWTGRLAELCTRLRRAVSDCLERELPAGSESNVARPVSLGAGDVTFGLDLPGEAVCTEWLREVARETPLSFFTEDMGWRHMGPGAEGETAMPNFAHGGPRIAIDPVDGTRNLMSDLRSAWTVVSFAPPGDNAPRLSDLTFGILSELPHSRMQRYSRFHSTRAAGCTLEERTVDGDRLISESPYRTDDDSRCEHGYFPFFRYSRSQVPLITSIECEFHRLLREHEGADSERCYDDQYISNGGQLALLTRGTYRFIADLRAWVVEQTGTAATCSKPYDSAGAILCAREAGAVVEAANGDELDFPLDATTPVSFVGWVNAATRERLRPHLDEALRAARD